MFPLTTNKPKKSRGAQPGNQNARKHVLESKAETVNEVIPTRNRGSLNDSLAAPRTAKRRRGGQPGNKNARTHGFYARRLPQSQLDGLEDTTVRSLEDEIEVMRVFSRKVAELGAEVDDLNEAKSLLNTLANATGSINRLVRTHTHIPDPTLDPQWMLRQALLELQEEWPELKRFANDYLSIEEISDLDARIAINAAREKKRLKREYGYPNIPTPAPAAPVDL